MRVALALGSGVFALLVAGAAAAIPVRVESCFNDTDCSGPECGGLVCDWTRVSPEGNPEKPYLCVPPGSYPKGMEGWCTGPSNENCKCRGLGAQCLGVYCTFTRPADAPGGGSGSVAGSGHGGGSSGSASGGSTSVGGTTSAGSAPVPEPEPEPKPKPEPVAPMGHEDTAAATHTSQACSVSIPGRESRRDCWGLVLGVAAVLAASCRKRARIPA